MNMNMNWRAVRAVAQKDLKVVFRSKMVVLPLIIVPLVMQVVLPGLMGLAANFAGEMLVRDLQDFEQMLAIMPEALNRQFAGMDPAQTFLTLMLLYAFAPLFLIVPMMVASVIAADSFVGERERKTLEALLYTPLTNNELLIAKMLTAWITAVAVGLAAFVLYGVVANGVGWPLMGRLFFPNLMWIVLVLWVAPAVAGLGLGVTVLLSTRVNTFQEAYQLGSIIVVPIVALVMAQFAGVLYLSAGLALAMGAIIWAINAVILWLGIKTFNRDALLARL